LLAPGGSRTSGRTTSLPPAASTTGVRTPGSEAQSLLSSSSSPHPRFLIRASASWPAA